MVDAHKSLKQLIGSHYLSRDSERQRYEHQVMQVVVDMAAKGPEAFDQRITSLVDEWRLQLFNADFTPTLTSLNADVDFDEIYAQNCQESPVLEARIEPVPDSAPSRKFASTQGSTELRRRKRMVLEPNVIMNRAFTRSLSRALAERNKEQIADIIHTAFENAAKEAEAGQHDDRGDEIPAIPEHVEPLSMQPVSAAAEGLFSRALGHSQDEQRSSRTASASPTLPAGSEDALPFEKDTQSPADGTPTQKNVSFLDSQRASHGLEMAVALSSNLEAVMSSRMPDTGRQSVPPSPSFPVGRTPASTPLAQKGVLRDDRASSIGLPPSPLLFSRPPSTCCFP